MGKHCKEKENGVVGGFDFGVGGILKGLGGLVDKLAELAEKGGEYAKTAEIQSETGGEGLKGVYGVSFKVGIGGEGVKMEPFGNVRTDQTTGEAVVQEVREPVVDVFEESDHILLVAEMPGIGPDDVRLEVKDDVLTVSAEKGAKKYRKEVLLSGNFAREKMEISCNNGVFEIKCVK